MSKLEREDVPGVWGAVIPEPIHESVGWWRCRFRCRCGQRFADRADYDRHYTVMHLGDVR